MQKTYLLVIGLVVITVLILASMILLKLPGDRATVALGAVTLFITPILMRMLTQLDDLAGKIVETKERMEARTDEVAAAVQEVHITMNSRLDELLNKTRLVAEAVGNAQGRRELVTEQDAAALKALPLATPVLPQKVSAE